MTRPAPRVRRERDGAWSCRLYLGRDAMGKPVRPYKRFPASATEDEAQALAETWASSLTADGAIGSARLCDLLSDYADMRERNGASPNSVRSYRLFAGYVRRYMPRADARRLTVMDLNRFEQRLLAPVEDGGAALSRNTVLCVHAFLRAAYNHLVDAGVCESNPMIYVSKPRPDRREAASIDEWDFEPLADRLGAYLGPDGPPCTAKGRSMAFAAWLSLMTGLRVGEACALRRRDVSRAQGFIHVSGSVIESAGRAPWRRESTKGGRCRNVSVTPTVLEAIGRHAAFVDDALGRRLPSSAPLVTADGSFMRPTEVSKAFSRIRAECGLPAGLTFHSLRHTHATWLIASGVDVKTVSERLGHADVATTLRIYAHVMPGRDAHAAEAFEAAAGAFGSVPKACQGPCGG